MARTESDIAGDGRELRNPEVAQREARTRGGKDGDTTAGLVRRLADEISTLFSKEMALLKSETNAAIGSARMGIGAIATGGAVAFSGFLVLLAAAVLGLSLVLQPWLAALIVGAVVIIVGLIMLKVGQRKLQPAAFKPDYTRESMKKDRDMLKGSPS